jgi:hypothetical protein
MKKWFSVRTWIPVVLGVLTLLPILGVDMVHAAGISFGDSDALKGFAEIAAVAINIFTFLALLVINFFSELIGTNFITGDQAMNAIQPMWIIIRNLVNVMFVVMLVFLAFSNLFASIAGEAGGSWTIKDKLPKIIISLVAINFSLLGFRLIIDAVNVGTVAILGIADHKLEGDDQSSMGTFTKERTWSKLSEEEAKTVTETPDFPKEDVKRGNSCTAQHRSKFGDSTNLDDELVVVLTDPKGPATYACRSFAAQINNTFCPDWKDYAKAGKIQEGASQDAKETTNASRASQLEGDTQCMFMINPNKLASETILQARNAPGQNLFMAFGTVFMHLEKLPSLAANLGSLDGVLINTLFSAIMSVMFLIALVVVFIALIGRIVVLWVAMVFSPAIVAVKIMGLDSEAGEQLTKVVTAIIMPLKIAAAFAVGFVMLSAMVTISPGMTGGESAFWFGSALSQMGQDEYAILWQVATVYLFWKAAQWAVEGNMADELTKGIFSGAQSLGSVAARAATIDRPLFEFKTADGKKNISLGALLSAPETLSSQWSGKLKTDRMKVLEDLGLTPNGATANQQKVNDFKANFKLKTEEKDIGESMHGLFKDLGVGGVGQIGKEVASALRSNSKFDETKIKAEMGRLENGSITAADLYKIVGEQGVNSKGIAEKARNANDYGTKSETDKGTNATGGDEKKKIEVKSINDIKKEEGSVISVASMESLLKGANNQNERAKIANTVKSKHAEIEKSITLDKGVKDNKSQGFFFTDRRGNYIDIGATLSGAGNAGDANKVITDNMNTSFKEMEGTDQTAVLSKINSTLDAKLEAVNKLDKDNKVIGIEIKEKKTE